MPFYEFVCQECLDKTEVGPMRYKDRPDAIDCPCGGQMKPCNGGATGSYPTGKCKGNGGGLNRPRI